MWHTHTPAKDKPSTNVQPSDFRVLETACTLQIQNKCTAKGWLLYICFTVVRDVEQPIGSPGNEGHATGCNHRSGSHPSFEREKLHGERLLDRGCAELEKLDM
jgi:hypothetical protein